MRRLKHLWKALPMVTILGVQMPVIVPAIGGTVVVATLSGCNSGGEQDHRQDKIPVDDWYPIKD